MNKKGFPKRNLREAFFDSVLLKNLNLAEKRHNLGLLLANSDELHYGKNKAEDAEDPTDERNAVADGGEDSKNKALIGIEANILVILAKEHGEEASPGEVSKNSPTLTGLDFFFSKSGSSGSSSGRSSGSCRSAYFGTATGAKLGVFRNLSSAFRTKSHDIVLL